MRFAPEDKNLCNHPEEFCGICVRLLEPPGPEMKHRIHFKGVYYPVSVYST